MQPMRFCDFLQFFAASINANKLIAKPQNPDEVQLRIVPAMKIANISDNVSNSDNILHHNLHHQNYTRCK